MIEIYKNYKIIRNPPEARQFKFHYQHIDFDGDCDTRFGNEKTVEDCKLSIDELEYDSK